MSEAHKKFEAVFDAFLGAVGIADAMSVVTGIFVSLMVGYVEHKGEDPNKSITINGGDMRDVTIHASKHVVQGEKS